MVKAVRFHEYGDTEVLRFEDVELPRPSDHEVLVRVAATAFNPFDTVLRSGVARQVFRLSLPHTPGLDLSGTVVEVGAAVESPVVGEDVIGLLPATAPGAAAEYVVAPASVLVPAPKSVPLTDSAAIPMAALTAWQALFEHGGLTPGQRVLINGAGGGVGGFAVQLAKRAGAIVLATASSPSAAQVHALGADEVIDYTAVDVARAVAQPVQLVVNLIAGSAATVEALAGVIEPGGRLVSTTVVNNEFPGHNVRVEFFRVRSDAEQLQAIVVQVDRGDIQLNIRARYRLDQTRWVHEQSAVGSVRGRTLLLPS
ncbi:NADP-dependent oxidoreductase [Streptomyces sp. NPDC005708]|uniref:NADP-dependent oxidoreductase n=1 Tax=Streptomyces sp. NPDC005708 TaxID=3154564 RepID=UPI0033CDD4B2